MGRWKPHMKTNLSLLALPSASVNSSGYFKCPLSALAAAQETGNNLSLAPEFLSSFWGQKRE